MESAPMAVMREASTSSSPKPFVESTTVSPTVSPTAPPARGLSQLVLIFALLVLGTWIVWDFLPALAWAVVVAIAIWPVIERSRLRKWNRTAAAIEATLVIGVILIAPLIVLGMQITHETIVTVQWIREVERTGIPVPEWVVQLP